MLSRMIEEVIAFFSSDKGSIQVNKFRIVEVKVCVAVIEVDVWSEIKNLNLLHEEVNISNNKPQEIDNGRTTL